MKGIKLCAECADYNWKKHKCNRGSSDETNARNPFYDDCPLPEVVEVVRCKDCENWIPGHITDQDDFIPPKCGKYQQMVGHSADDFCSLAEKQEGR